MTINLRYALTMLFLLIASQLLLAQNPNCTIIIPSAPFTAVGLATPYQLTAMNPADGPCHETNPNSSAFVQAAILDPASGQIYIYNPLVVDAGTAPAVPPVLPTLPPHAVVALWFGFNGDNLLQQGASPGVLDSSACVNGLPNNIFGQYSHCNAPAFFKAAHQALRAGQLRVPPLGEASDHHKCPTVRDFFVVDQDQSDNLPVTYLVSTDGLLAQNTSANQQTLSGATVLGNPSDNGLLDRFLDPAIGCTPWKATDLADPGHLVPGLALNEIQARKHQQRPVARIPAADPMVLNIDGTINLDKINAYRRGVDQREVNRVEQADTARYCRHMLRIAPHRLLRNKEALLAGPSPTGTANSLFTFMAQRFVASYNILDCNGLVEIQDPVSVTMDANGVAISATIDLPLKPSSQEYLDRYQSQDDTADGPPESEDETPIAALSSTDKVPAAIAEARYKAVLKH